MLIKISGIVNNMAYRMAGKVEFVGRLRVTELRLGEHAGFVLAKDYGKDEFTWGNPNCQVGCIVETKEEMLYGKRFIPKGILESWYKRFPLRSDVWGVYVEV